MRNDKINAKRDLCIALPVMHGSTGMVTESFPQVFQTSSVQSTSRPARFCMSGSLTDRERRLKGRARTVSVVIIIMAVKQ